MSAPATPFADGDTLWLYGFGRDRNPLPAQVVGFFDRAITRPPGDGRARFMAT
jgi:hypothetical protein